MVCRSTSKHDTESAPVSHGEIPSSWNGVSYEDVMHTLDAALSSDEPIDEPTSEMRTRLIPTVAYKTAATPSVTVRPVTFATPDALALPSTRRRKTSVLRVLLVLAMSGGIAFGLSRDRHARTEIVQHAYAARARVTEWVGHVGPRNGTTKNDPPATLAPPAVETVMPPPAAPLAPAPTVMRDDAAPSAAPIAAPAPPSTTPPSPSAVKKRASRARRANVELATEPIEDAASLLDRALAP